MKVEMVWNCKSSTFCLSLRVLRKPALSLEKALSSGAKKVNPPEPEVRSCELSWFTSCVVFSKRIRTENFFAFLRISTMSMTGPFGTLGVVGDAVGVAGTRGTVPIPGAAAGAVVGAIVGVAGGAVVGGAGGDVVGETGNAGAGGDFAGAEMGESWAEVV